MRDFFLDILKPGIRPCGLRVTALLMLVYAFNSSHGACSLVRWLTWVGRNLLLESAMTHNYFLTSQRFPQGRPAHLQPE
jgi:hypothetical protein